jgi:hypothetical protein
VTAVRHTEGELLDALCILAALRKPDKKSQEAETGFLAQ